MQKARLDAGGCELRFLGIADNPDRNAAGFLRKSQEFFPILRPADGRGREGMKIALLHAADRGKLRKA